MPVLLRSQLNRARESRTNMTKRPSDLLRIPSHDTQPRSHTSSSAALRRDSNQSTTNVSRRTVVSVIEFPELELPPPRKKGLLGKLKSGYHRLHLNYLLPLVFMMVYMVLGALLFLWLEGPADSSRRALEFGSYQRERELLLKRMDEIYKDRAAAKPAQRRLFLEEAVDYFHEQINVTFSNQTDWSITTALYYSGTVFTTIGWLFSIF
ncbi:TWiK family of potassium channels protein 12 [Toxocara canis]|uniref:TWiK family of potassium channels protein 12 n=1 Tax=Toxocara canis TaxID=6265 RepID=A0A0B2VB79_TOXCA|nr:TWiK family of potassium channels protein 12 [Toxocara canis]